MTEKIRKFAEPILKALGTGKLQSGAVILSFHSLIALVPMFIVVFVSIDIEFISKEPST